SGAAAGARPGRGVRADGRARQDPRGARCLLRRDQLPDGNDQIPADQYTGDLIALRTRGAARADRARGRHRSTLETARRDAAACRSVGSRARHQVPAARGPPQLDRVLPPTPRGERLQGCGRRTQAGGEDDRGGLRRVERLHDPYRAHGRSHRRRAGRAAAVDRSGAGMTWRVVVADRVAQSGLDLLSNTTDIEVVDVAGKPAELDKAIAGAHALIVRSETL